MTRLKTFIPLVPLTFALCALQAPAHATMPNDDAPAKTVSYSDLNLKKNADVARLFGRIKLAAASICSPLAGRDAQRAARFHHCIDDSMAKAVAQVDSPLLTERFAAARQEAILSPLVSRLNR
jgi:UrcA family protein